jgi:putative heme-binding domain-containing protein
LSYLNSKTIDEKLAKQWGKVRQSSKEKLAEIAKLEKSYRGAPLWAFNAGAGKEHFKKLCSACHKIGNEGTDIGPKIVGSGSKGVRYFAENIVDPNAVIGSDYQTSVILTSDGRVVTGLVEKTTDTAITLQTPTNPPKKIVVPREDIDEMELSGQSLMPEQMLETLDERQIIELFKYLSSI